MTKVKPLAWVYVRWSSDGQSDGDSETRQLRDVFAWCERKGFATDPSRVLVDRGRSGFAGKHLVNGELGKFVRLVETAKIPAGSCLAVEDYDRISRLPITQARRVIELFTARDIKVGVVAGDQILDAKSSDELTGAVGMIMRVYLAHEESAKKSTRFKSVWEAKRKAAAERKAKMNSPGPRWLDWNGEDWIPNHHATTVRRIFDLAISNHGCNTIAAMLNRDGVATMTIPGAKFGPGNNARKWIANSVMQVLRSHAAYGAWMPRTLDRKLIDEQVETVDGIVTRYRSKLGREETGEPILDYYHAVVDRGTWERAQDAIKDRVKGGGNRGTMRNVLQNVIFCHHCAGRLQLREPAPGLSGKLYCHNALAGACERRGRIDAAPIVEAVLTRAAEAFDIITASASPERTRLDSEIAEMAAQRDRLQKRVDDWALEDAPALSAQSERFARMIYDLGFKIVDAQQRRETLEAQRSERPAEYEALLADYRGESGPAKDRAVRLLNAALRSVIERVNIVIGDVETDFGTIASGSWRMRTVNGWAETSSGSKRWDTNLSRQRGAEMLANDPAAPAWLREGAAEIVQEMEGQPTEGRDIAKRIEARDAKKRGKARAA